MYSFSYLEPVCCSMSSSNCCFLTCTHAHSRLTCQDIREAGHCTPLNMGVEGSLGAQGHCVLRKTRKTGRRKNTYQNTQGMDGSKQAGLARTGPHTHHLQHPEPLPRRTLSRALKQQHCMWGDRKSTRLNSSHTLASRMPSSA